MTYPIRVSIINNLSSFRLLLLVFVLKFKCGVINVPKPQGLNVDSTGKRWKHRLRLEVHKSDEERKVLIEICKKGNYKTRKDRTDTCMTEIFMS